MLSGPNLFSYPPTKQFGALRGAYSFSLHGANTIPQSKIIIIVKLMCHLLSVNCFERFRKMAANFQKLGEEFVGRVPGAKISFINVPSCMMIASCGSREDDTATELLPPSHAERMGAMLQHGAQLCMGGQSMSASLHDLEVQFEQLPLAVQGSIVVPAYSGGDDGEGVEHAKLTICVETTERMIYAFSEFSSHWTLEPVGTVVAMPNSKAE